MEVIDEDVDDLLNVPSSPRKQCTKISDLRVQLDQQLGKYGTKAREMSISKVVSKR